MGNNRLNCPFPLPIEFRQSERFKRKTKNLPMRIENELIKMLGQFISGEPQERYKPEKIKGRDNLYKISLDKYRVLYELQVGNSTTVGILRDFIPRNNDYRELRNR